jgi:paraquat-inducible protein B
MPELRDIPEAVAAPKSRWSLVWLVPIVAVLIGVSLAVKAYLDQGPAITISFKTGEGLEAGKTKLRYKDVEVGLVTSVKLSEQGVIATAELAKGTERGLVEDTRFWVVSPRIAGGNVSGLSTLLSGAYIGVDVGKSTTPARNFVGLEKPPVFTTDLPGRQYVLNADSIGSLDVGSPVFFRGVQVGQVASYELNPDGKGVTLTVFVRAPYERHVTSNTRFWHASGIDISFDASGLKIDTQGLVSIAIGGIAFATPATSQQASPAESNAVFKLAVDRVEAMRQPDRIVDTYLLVFRQSTRGLSVGAPLDFRGIVFGEVVAIYADLDPKTLDSRMLVEVNVFPERIASRRLKTRKPDEQRNEAMIQRLIDKGLRAQLRTGNLVTGQLYVALDFFPGVRRVKLDFSQSPVELPTVPGSLEDLQQTITLIAKKLDRLPLEEIGANLNRTLQDVNQLVKRLDTEVTPEARDALAESRKTLADASRALSSVERSAAPDGPLAQELQDSVREIGRAARTMRLLADYLERHPEALIVGKQENGK